MTLTPTQSAIIADPRPIRIVIACPGSGKTTLLSSAIFHESFLADDPSRIATLTFTHSAAQEIQTRFLNGIQFESGTFPELEKKETAERCGIRRGRGNQFGFVGTLHSYVVRYLHQRGKSFAVMSEDEDRQEIERIASELRYKGGKEALRDLIRMGPNQPMVGEIGLAADQYWKRQFKSKLLSFDGLLWYGLKIMRAEGAPAVSALFVDEAQDSTTVDGLIYDELKAPRLMAVGDLDQNLFSFRGGSMAWLMDMANKHGYTALEENHRSGQAICAAASNLIQHNKGRIDKRTISARNTPGSVVAKVFEREADEFAFVIGKLKELL